MKKISLICLLSLLLLGLPVSATETPSILITEFSVASATAATEEFVEIANIGSKNIELSGVELVYRSASGSAWQKKAELAGELEPNRRVVIATANFINDASFIFVGGLAAGGGHLRLRAGELAIDTVGWGNAVEPLGSAVAAPQAGQSAKRAVDEDGYFRQIGDNSADWFISETPSPRDDGLALETQTPVDSQPEPVDEITPTPSAPAPKNYARLELSELMPDPIAPLSDADDEFVEIRNPHNFSVSLDDYYLEIGSRLTKLDGYQIRPLSYLAIFSSDTSISLSNAGKDIRLFDGNGRQLDEAVYPKAEPGMSWSQVGGQWGWAEPSPMTANKTFFEEESEDNPASVLSRSRSYQTGGSLLSDTNARTVFEEPPVAEVEPVDYALLAGVGGLSVCYLLYEYRQDMGIRLQQLRRHLARRRKNGPKIAWRRSNRTGQRRWWRQDSLRTWLGAWYRKRRSSG